MLLAAVFVMGCGDDDPQFCTHASCDNPPAVTNNVVGTWTVQEDGEDGGTVTFNGDGTAESSTRGTFEKLYLNNGELQKNFT